MNLEEEMETLRNKALELLASLTEEEIKELLPELA